MEVLWFVGMHDGVVATICFSFISVLEVRCFLMLVFVAFYRKQFDLSSFEGVSYKRVGIPLCISFNFNFILC